MDKEIILILSIASALLSIVAFVALFRSGFYAKRTHELLSLVHKKEAEELESKRNSDNK